MKINLKKFQNLIRSPSGGALFALTSVILLSVVVLATISVFLSGIGGDKSAVSTKNKTLKVSSTISSSSAKVQSSSQQPKADEQTIEKAVQTTSQNQETVVPSQPCPNQVQIPQSQESQVSTVNGQDLNNQSQALREAQLKQEAENQQEAERLKTEYESAGYSVNIIEQNSN